MIVYNVTCSMDNTLAEEWLDWMLSAHIPEVMQTGCFVDFKVLKLLTQAQDDNGVNYAVQYRAADIDAYERYRDNFAPELQQKTREKYGDSILAFRTLLEEVTGR